MGPWKKIYVRHDGLPEGISLPCWTQGELWNGFQCPSFEFDDAMKLLNLMNEAKGTFDQTTGTYDKDKDAFVFDDPNYEKPEDRIETYGAHERTVHGKKMKLYDIGSWSWSWYEPDETADVGDKED